MYERRCRSTLSTVLGRTDLLESETVTARFRDALGARQVDNRQDAPLNALPSNSNRKARSTLTVNACELTCHHNTGHQQRTRPFGDTLLESSFIPSGVVGIQNGGGNAYCFSRASVPCTIGQIVESAVYGRCERAHGWLLAFFFSSPSPALTGAY